MSNSAVFSPAGPPRSAVGTPEGTARARAAARRRAATHDDFLSDLFATIGVARWTAFAGPLELIELETGDPSSTAFCIEPECLRPGALWADCVYPPDRNRMRAFLTRAKPGRKRSVDYRVIVAEGELVWVRHWILKRTPSPGGRQILQGLLLIIAEQKHLEWECLRVSERECNRLGQELHDDLCQVLAGVTCMTRALEERAARVAPRLGDDFRELAEELSGAGNRVRAMAHGLFPAQLEYLTLRQALNEFTRQTKLRFAINATVEFSGKLPPHSPDQILHIFRIIQEAVSNSYRHGHATRVRISVAAGPRNVQVRIEDNGNGFPPSTIRPEGIGIHVMLYRAHMLAGELRMRNLARGGALVELTYPLTGASGNQRHPATSASTQP